jgi:hypothetical protein
MKSFYELKRFKTQNDRDLIKALSIYANNIEPILRTDTKEIIYWIDKYSDVFDDKFLVFGFYLNNQLIGYAQLAYFSEEKLIFVDYIVIGKEFRRNNTFYELIEELKEYFVENNIFYDYILAEVGGFNEDQEPTNATKSLIRLLKMLGFGVVKADYFHPELGKVRHNNDLQSILMLFTPNEVKSLKKETFLTFINTIYFKHYRRWYSAFFNEYEIKEYDTHLLKLLDNIKHLLRKKEIIEVSIYSNVYSIGKEKSFQQSPPLVFKLLSIFCSILLTSLSFIVVYFLLNLSNLKHSSTSSAFFCSGVILVFVFIELKLKITAKVSEFLFGKFFRSS